MIAWNVNWAEIIQDALIAVIIQIMVGIKKKICAARGLIRMSYRIYFKGHIDVNANTEDEAMQKAEEELNWAQGVSFDLNTCEET